jgi:DNA replication protein DnaC
MPTECRYKEFSKKLTSYRKQMETCELCKGEGWVPKEKKKGIVLKYVKCKCKSSYEFNKQMVLANIPRRRFNILSNEFVFKRISATNCLTNQKISVKKVVIDKYIEKLEEAKQQGIGLMLFGNPGTGKTTTALYIIASLLDNVDCYYIYFKDLMTLLLNSYDDSSKKPLFQEIINVDMLVVDELSLIGRVTPHAVAEFTSVCKQRLENQTPTIIISNYNSLDDVYHNFGAPMESLIIEAFLPIKFTGKDLRTDKYAYMKNFFE